MVQSPGCDRICPDRSAGSGCPLRGGHNAWLLTNAVNSLIGAHGFFWQVLIKISVRKKREHLYCSALTRVNRTPGLHDIISFVFALEASSLVLTPALTSTANNSWLLNKPASDVSGHIDFHLFIIIIAGVRIQSWLVCVHRCAGVTPHVPTSIFTGKLEEWWRSACVTMNHSVAHETPHRQSWQTIRDERHAVGWPRGPAMKTLVGCVTYAAAR